MKAVRTAFTILGLFAAAFASGAQAAPIFYDFLVSFHSGPLNGSSTTGHISVDGLDCPANKCSGVFSPGNAAKTLLTLNITVAGTLFTAASDTGFPAFPQVGFDAIGDLISIDFDGLVNGNELQLFGQLNQPNAPAVALFVPAVGQASTGTISQAPEPGTAALLAGALLAGLAFGRSRKTASPMPS